MRQILAYALIAAGVVSVIAFVASVAAVFIATIWWIWTQDSTAWRLAATGLVVGVTVAFAAQRIEAP